MARIKGATMTHKRRTKTLKLAKRNMYFQSAVTSCFLQCDHLVAAKYSLIKGK